jgi:hypothetical protein
MQVAHMQQHGRSAAAAQPSPCPSAGMRRSAATRPASAPACALNPYAKDFVMPSR